MDARSAGEALGFLARGAFSALYPPHCLSCGAPLDDAPMAALCHECAAQADPVLDCCPLCGTPQGHYACDGPRCDSCRGRKLHFTAARGAFLFDGAVRRLLHRLKYERFAAAAVPLGKMAAGRLKEGIFPGNPRFDALVPVPSSFWQRFKRGFNQTELIAAAVSRACKVPVAKALRKTRITEAQVGLSRENRLQNMRGAFSARKRLVPSGGTVLVMDDVITTSSTVSECAKALLDAGAKEVFAFAVARQP